MTITPDGIPTPQALLAPRKNFLSRLLTLPVAWRWALIIVGLLLAVGGSILIYSTTSQLATYQSVHVRGDIHFHGTLSPSGFFEGDVSLENGATYHIRGKDFSPHVNYDFIGNVEYVYRTDNRVVQITVFDSNGQNPRVFTTAEYAQITQNRTIGVAALIAGLVLAVFAFTVPIVRGRLGKNKKDSALNKELQQSD